MAKFSFKRILYVFLYIALLLFAISLLVPWESIIDDLDSNQRPRLPSKQELDQNLAGAWRGSDGNVTMFMFFKENGLCAIVMDKDSVSGIYTAKDNFLKISLSNGKKIKAQYDLQGKDKLILDGESIFTKENMPEVDGQVGGQAGGQVGDQKK